MPSNTTTSSQPVAVTGSALPHGNDAHSTLFAVSGDGTVDCADAFYGGCVPELLLQPVANGPWPTLAPGEFPPRMTFDSARTAVSTAILLGPVAGAPSSIEPGTWRIGIARVVSSDAGVCDSPCSSPYFPSSREVLCVADFEVAPDTPRVDVRAHFRPQCSIHINLGDAPPSAPPPLLPVAQLGVRAKGTCHIVDFGGCGFVLLLTTDAATLARWKPGPTDMRFQQSVTSLTKARVAGAPPNLPSAIPAGHWYAGLAIVQTSDIPSAGPSGELECLTEFDVLATTASVLIKADYGPPCRVSAEVGPAATD
jgi:hypothetical protein